MKRPVVSNEADLRSYLYWSLDLDMEEVELVVEKVKALPDHIDALDQETVRANGRRIANDLHLVHNDSETQQEKQS